MNRLTGVRLLAVVMALLLGGFGCSSASGDSTSDAAPANGATLEPAEFEAAMQRAGTVIVDVRTPEEFAGGHIAGAVNIDVSASDFSAKIADLAKDVPYAVYCRSGNRSAAALAQMESAGFMNAYHLGGGVGAWTSSGRALVTA